MAARALSVAVAVSPAGALGKAGGAAAARAGASGSAASSGALFGGVDAGTEGACAPGHGGADSSGPTNQPFSSALATAGRHEASGAQGTDNGGAAKVPAAPANAAAGATSITVAAAASPSAASRSAAAAVSGAGAAAAQVVAEAEVTSDASSGLSTLAPSGGKGGKMPDIGTRSRSSDPSTAAVDAGNGAALLASLAQLWSCTAQGAVSADAGGGSPQDTVDDSGAGSLDDSVAAAPGAAGAAASSPASAATAVAGAITAAAAQTLGTGRLGMLIADSAGQSGNPAGTGRDWDQGGEAAAAAAAPDTAAAGASAASTGVASDVPQLLQGLFATGAPGVAGVASASISGVPVSDQAWPHALAAQVQWMANAQVQSATLRLSPEHLGPLEIRIDLQHSQINVSFTAHHPETRSALADSVPRLRELLAAGGLSLGQANVQQQSESASQAAPSARAGGQPGGETVEPVAVAPARALGLIDEYA